MLSKVSIFERVSFIVFVLLCVSSLQGCALYDALSGDGNDGPQDGVPVDVDAGNYPSVNNVGGVVNNGVGDNPNEPDSEDAGYPAEDASGVVCANNCINGCSETDADQCNDTIASISVGHHHACALTEEGDVYCWGSNSNGQLGDKVRGGSREFTQALKVEGLGKVTSVSAGGLHTCAVHFDEIDDGAHKVWCWGDNGYGQATGDKELNTSFGSLNLVPMPQLQSSNEVRYGDKVYASGSHSCINMYSTAGPVVEILICWGNRSDGRLGDLSSTSGYQFPRYRADSGSYGFNFNGMFDSKYDHACSIAILVGDNSANFLNQKAIWCWGRNEEKQLDGDVNRGGMVMSGSGKTILSTGKTHTCYGKPGGNEIYCWGDMFSRVEHRSFCSSNEDAVYVYEASNPTPPHNENKKICKFSFGMDNNGMVDLVSGDDAVCILLGTGGLMCLGLEQPADVNLTQMVLNGDNSLKIEQFELGQDFACALVEDGSVQCWGRGEAGAPVTNLVSWSDSKMFEVQFN